MRLVDELKEEHLLIEHMVGSLRTFAASAGAPESDRRAFAEFFERFAGDYHHEREEQVLFPALETEASLPRERGPMAAITEDHRALDALLETYLREGNPSVANVYADLLLHHIDAENSVLFPESVERLRRVGVRDLQSRRPTEIELRAKAVGEQLLLRYPPTENPALIRGDGCVMCPAYGGGCDGVERTWWTQSEWEGLASELGD